MSTMTTICSDEGRQVVYENIYLIIINVIKSQYDVVMDFVFHVSSENVVEYLLWFEYDPLSYLYSTSVFEFVEGIFAITREFVFKS